MQRAGLGIATVMLTISLLSTAAVAENERAVSVGLGWATFSVPGEQIGNMEPPALSPDVGGALSVTYERAVGTDIMLRGSFVGGLFYGDDEEAKQSATSYAALADAGIVFRFDVLKYVPYAFGGVGAVVSGGGPIDQGFDFVLAIGGGLDVLSSRARSFGIEGKLASFGGDITVFTLGVRGTVRWGYF